MWQLSIEGYSNGRPCDVVRESIWKKHERAVAPCTALGIYKSYTSKIYIYQSVCEIVTTPQCDQYRYLCLASASIRVSLLTVLFLFFAYIPR
jgi:hypothetical protein